jgi:hypothetical protein
MCVQAVALIENTLLRLVRRHHYAGTLGSPKFGQGCCKIAVATQKLKFLRHGQIVCQTMFSNL